MKDQISLTVPNELNALRRAAEFFGGLAWDAESAGEGPEYNLQQDRKTKYDPEQEGPTGIYERGFADGRASGYSEAEASNPDIDRSHIEARIPASEGGTMPDPDPDHVPDEDYPAERDPSAAFGSGGPDAPAATTPETSTGSGSDAPAGGAESGQTSPSADLDLDADGLPWDGRIHSSSKKKLAKTKQWKKRRKPNDQAESQWDAYVASVEAELRRVMQAGPHAPVEQREQPAGPTPPPAAADKPAAPSGPTPPPAATGTAEIKTLPELFRLITDNNIGDDRVMAAINAQGIESLPLLGARPDLIPAVAAALQEG